MKFENYNFDSFKECLRFENMCLIYFLFLYVCFCKIYLRLAFRWSSVIFFERFRVENKEQIKCTYKFNTLFLEHI